MKELALGAAMLASVAFSKYEIAISPDMHMDAMSVGHCDFIASDQRMAGSGFDRLLCEVSQDVPYDSLSCFFGSFMVQKMGRDAHEHDETEIEEIIEEIEDDGIRFS